MMMVMGSGAGREGGGGGRSSSCRGCRRRCARRIVEVVLSSAITVASTAPVVVVVVRGRLVIPASTQAPVRIVRGVPVRFVLVLCPSDGPRFGPPDLLRFRSRKPKECVYMCVCVQVWVAFRPWFMYGKQTTHRVCQSSPIRFRCPFSPKMVMKTRSVRCIIVRDREWDECKQARARRSRFVNPSHMGGQRWNR